MRVSFFSHCIINSSKDSFQHFIFFVLTSMMSLTLPCSHNHTQPGTTPSAAVKVTHFSFLTEWELPSPQKVSNAGKALVQALLLPLTTKNFWVDEATVKKNTWSSLMLLQVGTSLPVCSLSNDRRVMSFTPTIADTKREFMHLLEALYLLNQDSESHSPYNMPVQIYWQFHHNLVGRIIAISQISWDPTPMTQEEKKWSEQFLSTWNAPSFTLWKKSSWLSMKILSFQWRSGNPTSIFHLPSLTALSWLRR